MNKSSKTYGKIKPLASILLEGRVLCIDPSTGSASSLPGFAVYEQGELVDSGVIEVDTRLNRSLRLYEISRTIREEFETPDVLIVEFIPNMVYGNTKGYKSKMNSVSLMALQKAIGAIMGAHPFQHVLEIPEAAWRPHKFDGYNKTDEHDAICLGICAVETAKQILQDDD